VHVREEMKMGIQRGVSGLLLWEEIIRIASLKAMGQILAFRQRCCAFTMGLWGEDVRSLGQPWEGATLLNGLPLVGTSMNLAR
jgi:hypothetical protein